MNRIHVPLEIKGIKQTWLAPKRIGKSINQTKDNVRNHYQQSLEQLFEIAKTLGIDVNI